LRADIALAPCRKSFAKIYDQGSPCPVLKTNDRQEGYHPLGQGELGPKSQNLSRAAIKLTAFNAAKQIHHLHADFMARRFPMRNQKPD
jgi:hypothetical protein